MTDRPRGPRLFKAGDHKPYRRKSALLRQQDRCPAEQVWDSESKVRIENQTKGLNNRLLAKGAKLTQYTDGRTQAWLTAHVAELKADKLKSMERVREEEE